MPGVKGGACAGWIDAAGVGDAVESVTELGGEGGDGGAAGGCGGVPSHCQSPESVPRDDNRAAKGRSRVWEAVALFPALFDRGFLGGLDLHHAAHGFVKGEVGNADFWRIHRSKFDTNELRKAPKRSNVFEKFYR